MWFDAWDFSLLFASHIQTCGGVTFTAFDVGGHEMWRHLWSTFYANVDAIVFVVDSVDQSRFPEVKDELLALLDDPDQGSVPFLVMLNKQDLREAVSAVDMVDILEVCSLTSTKRLTAQLWATLCIICLCFLAGTITHTSSNWSVIIARCAFEITASNGSHLQSPDSTSHKKYSGRQKQNPFSRRHQALEPSLLILPIGRTNKPIERLRLPPSWRRVALFGTQLRVSSSCSIEHRVEECTQNILEGRY